MLPRIPLFAYDWSLVAIVLAINFTGLIVLKSAAPSSALWQAQIVWSLIAIAGATTIQIFTRRSLMTWSYLLYGISLGLLVLVLIVGKDINGAKAWFGIGPFGIQPSELAKVTLILALARLMASRGIRTFWDYFPPLLLTVPVLFLVLVEPDLGGVLVMLSILGSVLWLSGLPWKHLLIGIGLLATLTPTVVWPHLKPYQQERILSVLDPSRDPLGSGFQVSQSMIAIGSGGISGKGYGQGTQAQLGFIPERQTDFIYAVLAEEWGFVGGLFLLLLYGLLFLRLASMALECSQTQDRIIIIGTLGMLAFQVLINIGVTLGVAPVTGITLPLLSKGGSSLIAIYLTIGIALMVHRDRHRDV